MPGSNGPLDLSEKDKQLLAREIFKAQVRKLRSQHRKGHRLLRWLDSPAVTAIIASLITVGLGGIIGERITSSYQARLKEREIALVSYKDFLAKKQEAEQRAFGLIKTTLFATEDFISATGKEFNPVVKGADVDRKSAEEQRVAIQKAYNDADREWRIGADEAGMLMVYYHEDSKDVEPAWGEVQNSVTAYKKCAEGWYSIYINDSSKTSETRSACAAEKEATSQAVQHLTQRIEKTNKYPWRPPE